MKVSKKLAIVAGTTAVAMAGAGVGFAYFTGGGGSGTGSAGTAASADHTVTPTATATGVAYDGGTTSVPITLSNLDKYSQKVAGVVMSINLSDASWAAHNCPTDSFSMTGSVTGPWTVPASADGVVPGQVTGITGYNIAFVDNSGENQDGCIGFSVPLSLTAS